VRAPHALFYLLRRSIKFSLAFTLIGKEVSKMLCRLGERGQGLVEYAFLILLIAAAVLFTLFFLGPVIGNVFTKLNSNFVTY